MAEVKDDVINEDGTHELTIDFSTEELKAIMFAGLAATAYNKELLVEYSESTLADNDLDQLADFKKASEANDLSVEDGFKYLQIGVQVALTRGVQQLTEADEVDCDSDCEVCSCENKFDA